MSLARASKCMKNHIPLLQSSIMASVTDSLQQQCRVHLFSEIDSTNDYLKHQVTPLDDQFEICLAEAQTKGRGRHGKVWCSPYGENVYCSIGMVMKQAVETLSSLSLVAALAILESIQDHFSINGLQLKWPNDLIHRGRKLAGILIETKPLESGRVFVIIGIGVNVNMRQAPTTFDQPWTSLALVLNRVVNRNSLTGELIQKVAGAVRHYQAQGFSDFMGQWQQYDGLKGKTIAVYEGEQKIIGQALGVDQQGRLLLELPAGDVFAYTAGEVSVR